MKKSEVYSWRIGSELKAALEESAHAEQTSVAHLLERIVKEWLSSVRSSESEEETQQRLHEAADKCIGKLQGGDPHLAEQASLRIREQLKGRYASKRTN